MKMNLSNSVQKLELPAEELKKIMKKGKLPKEELSVESPETNGQEVTTLTYAPSGVDFEDSTSQQGSVQSDSQVISGVTANNNLPANSSVIVADVALIANAIDLKGHGYILDDNSILKNEDGSYSLTFVRGDEKITIITTGSDAATFVSIVQDLFENNDKSDITVPESLDFDIFNKNLYTNRSTWAGEPHTEGMNYSADDILGDYNINGTWGQTRNEKIRAFYYNFFVYLRDDVLTQDKLKEMFSVKEGGHNSTEFSNLFNCIWQEVANSSDSAMTLEEFTEKFLTRFDEVINNEDVCEEYKTKAPGFKSAQTVTNESQDEKGNKLTTMYNSDGTVVKMTTDMQGLPLIQENYDAKGNLVTTLKFNEWNEEGKFFANVYDAKGNRTGKNYYTDSTCSTIKSYSELKDGLWVSQTDYGADGNITNIVKREYYADGKLKKNTNYQADGKTLKSIYEYKSDGTTLIKYSNYKQNGSLNFINDYSASGAKLKTTYYADDGKTVKSVYEYAADGKKYSKITYYESDGKTERSVITYKYNNNGSYTVTTKYPQTGNFEIREYGANDVLNSTTTTTYNENGGYTVVITDADGNEISRVNYDKDGNEIDKSGTRSQAPYDSDDSSDLTVTTTKNSDGTTTETAKTKNGTIVSVTTKDKDGLIEKIVNYKNGEPASYIIFSHNKYNGYCCSQEYDAKTNEKIASYSYYDKYGTQIESYWTPEKNGSYDLIHYNKDGTIQYKETQEYNKQSNRWITTLRIDYEYTQSGHIETTTENGNITETKEYVNNSDKSYSVYTKDASGKLLKKEECDKAGNTVKTVAYKYDANNNRTEIIRDKNNKIILIKKFDKDNNDLVKSTTESKDGSNNQIITITYKDGSVIKIVNGLLDTEEIYNEKGELVTTTKYGIEGSNSIANVYNAKGERICKKYYYDNDYTRVKSKHDLKDGHFVSQTSYDINGNITEISTNDEFYDNGKRKKTTFYEADGKTKKSVYEFADDGETKIKITYYEADGKTVKQTVTYQYNADGSYKKHTHTNSGTVITQEFDAAGNQKTTGKNALKGSISNSGYTFPMSEVYNGIVNGLDYNMSGWLDLRFVFEYKNYDKYGGSFLEAAIVNPKDKDGKPIAHVKPNGATKTYNSYLETDYADILKAKLQDVHNNFGYEFEDIKGYFFPSHSDISRDMADLLMAKQAYYDNNDGTYKESDSFIDKYLEALATGNGLPIGFNTGIYKKTKVAVKDENGKVKKDAAGNTIYKETIETINPDLYYAIGKISVIDSKLNGNKLTLTLADVYDFDPDYINKLTNGDNNLNTALNAVGAAAMQDGKLQPYFEVFEVEITLDWVQLDELRKKGIIT